ncbi:MAG: hypothetical protein HQK66_05925 [Desulfamplus sp.]|nr:hypothetical protein [Desulfamplus sp.]
MIKIGTITFPQDAADKVAECYTQLPSPEGNVKLIDTYIYNDGEGDNRAFSIFEYDDASEKDMEVYLKKRYEAFSKIPGLTYTMEDWIRVQDALRMLAEGEFDTNVISSNIGL